MSPGPRDSLARRAFPAIALIGAAGSLVWVLDRPTASGANDDAAVSADGADNADVATPVDDDSGIDPPSVDGTDSQTDESASQDASDTSSSTTKSTKKKKSTTTTASTTPDTTTKPTTSTKKKRTTTSTAPDTTSAPRTTQAPPASSSSSCTTYDGAAINTRYGTIQVRASVSSSGKICSVKVIRAASSGRSGRINQSAIPVLNQEAMSAQSAKIHAVSGATVTSRAYAKSLQSVIDAAT